MLGVEFEDALGFGNGLSHAAHHLFDVGTHGVFFTDEYGGGIFEAGGEFDFFDAVEELFGVANKAFEGFLFFLECVRVVLFAFVDGFEFFAFELHELGHDKIVDGIGHQKHFAAFGFIAFEVGRVGDLVAVFSGEVEDFFLIIG